VLCCSRLYSDHHLVGARSSANIRETSVYSLFKSCMLAACSSLAACSASGSKTPAPKPGLHIDRQKMA
jgi:hypothetical protein